LISHSKNNRCNPQNNGKNPVKVMGPHEMIISPTRNKIKTHAHKLKTFNSNNFHLKIQHHAQGQAVWGLGNGGGGLGKCAGENGKNVGELAWHSG